MGGARGVWSIALRKSHGALGLDTVIVSTDLAPSPGISRVRFLFIYITYNSIHSAR